MSDESEEVFLSARQVCERYGGCSTMWLHRKVRDDATFPRPTFLGSRRYFKLSQLNAWEKAQALLPPRVRGVAAKRTVTP